MIPRASKVGKCGDVFDYPNVSETSMVSTCAKKVG